MEKKNEKKTFSEALSLYFYGFHGRTFAEAIEAIKETEEEALEEVKRNGDYLPQYEFVELRILDCCSEGVYYSIEARYQETDEAYKERLKKEKSYAKELKQRELEKEREEYERLKKKFENA